MIDPLFLTIPTYRLSEACQTANKYSKNFQKFHHRIPILIFDDCKQSHLSLTVSSRKIEEDSEIYYVGATHKKQFLNRLKAKFNEPHLIESVFRPSYGGNRNFTLAYTLGSKMMSVDDDMNPIGIFKEVPCEKDSVCHGVFVPKNSNGYQEKDQDVAGAFLKVLGKKVGDLDLSRGKHILDDSVDFFSNNTKERLTDEVKLILKPGRVQKNCIVKIAQTYRTGSPDIDAIDYIDAYFEDPFVIATNDLNRIFALNYFTPCITKNNWRIDSGVCALDNTEGLPPFIPTTLRFEDYIFRIWAQKDNVATAHVNAVQTHRKSLNRPSLASSFLNEEMAALLKRELRKLVQKLHETHIDFSRMLEISNEDIMRILERGLDIKDKAEKEAKNRPKESNFFFKLANDIDLVFDHFERKIFARRIKKIMQNEFALLLETMNLWPKLIDEIRHMPKNMKKLSTGEEIENFIDLDTVFKS